VDVVEPDERRHALARRARRTRVWRPAEAATGAAELPAGFECSARNDAFALLQRQLAPHGRLCVLSDATSSH